MQPSSSSILLIGSSGLVGSKIKQIFLKRKLRLLCPSSSELNILNNKTIQQYLQKTNPSVLINCAAYTDMEQAEKQRGDKAGLAWQINVKGAKNIALACKSLDIFLIHISTDSVFYDFKNNKSGYKEILKPIANVQKLSWYGYTKLKAEQLLLKSKVKCAIIRISYPFGNSNSQKDFVLKTKKYIKNSIPFFDDFFLTPTFIPDLTIFIEEIIKLKKPGIFHVTSPNITTPKKVAHYIAKKLKLKNLIKSQKLNVYLKNNKTYIRPQNSSLDNTKTQKLLGVKFNSWQEAINKYYYEISSK